ncbi:hydroxyquinol 1,2-dioxygenase [Cupriavidus sp. CP313]
MRVHIARPLVFAIALTAAAAGTQAAAMSHPAARDPHTDGARSLQEARDPYSEGARAFDPYTDAARKVDTYYEGARRFAEPAS